MKDTQSYREALSGTLELRNPSLEVGLSVTRLIRKMDRRSIPTAKHTFLGE